MNAIEQLITTAEANVLMSLAEIVKAEFDKLRQKVKNNADFLADMNAANAAHDPGADFGVAYIASPAPELPNLDNVTPFTETGGTTAENGALVEKLVEKLDLEKEQQPESKTVEYNPDQSHELLLPTDTRYFQTCRWLIENEKSVQQLQEFLISRKLRVDEKEYDHMKNIIWFRSELLKGKDGCFDLAAIVSQNDTTKQEIAVWEALAKKLNQK